MNAAVLVLDRHRVDQQPPHITVGSSEAHHHVANRLAPALRRDVRDFIVGHVGAVLAQTTNFAWRRAARELLGRPSEDAVSGRIGKDDRAVRVTYDDAPCHRFVDGSEIASLRGIPSARSRTRPRPRPTEASGAPGCSRMQRGIALMIPPTRLRLMPRSRPPIRWCSACRCTTSACLRR